VLSVVIGILNGASEIYGRTCLLFIGNGTSVLSRDRARMSTSIGEPKLWLLTFLIGFTCCGLLSVATAPRAIAQSQPPAATEALPSDTVLDAWLAARDWNGLGAALSRPADAASFNRRLNWLHTRIDAGGGSLLPQLFARDLWAVGTQLNIADPAKDLRLTAGMMTLYSYELNVIDGTKCEDRSAPGHRIDQLMMNRAATFKYLQALPEYQKGNVVNLAIALERKTAPLRKDDDLICRDGLEQMRAGLERGAQREVPAAPGQFGKQVEVTAPPGWAPKFVASEVYRPLQEKARSQMRSALLKLIEGPR
jgi:hypothetical protein